MECEKNMNVEYTMSEITYTYQGSSMPALYDMDGNNIIYSSYDNSYITGLIHVDLYDIAFPGDKIILMDLSTGTAISSSTIAELTTGP